MKDKIKNIIKNNYKWIICFICLVLFLAFAEDVFNHEIMKGDIVGYNFVKTYLINDKITPVVKVITFFGSATFLIPLVILLFILIRKRKIGISICTNLVLVTILNQVFKFILQRPRPTEYQIVKEAGYSFPSGHSMISMAFYGYLVYLIYTNVKNKYIKITLISILSLLILLIGLSRIYLGVHYTSDVIAGFLLAISYLILYISIIKKELLYEK